MDSVEYSKRPMGARLNEDGKLYRVGKCRYSNGDLYDGEFVDGMRHGKGVMLYKNGDKYVERL